MHKEEKRKRGRQFITDHLEKKETFRVGLKKSTIEKYGGACHLRELIIKQLEKNE